MPEYIYKNHQLLRCGYTTGTCAAAAAKAAARMLFSGQPVFDVSLTTPAGITLHLPVLEIKQNTDNVTCAIQKDAGDDADQTNGILIYATVSRTPADITVDGGIGIGRVTLPGLEQPVGAAAINSIPRKMITEEVLREARAVGYQQGLSIIISAPEGVEIAQKTFNPRLGIQGGISILGTSGIVEPMSEKALIDTIHVEMKQKKAQKTEILLLSPGNYGKNFTRETWNLDLETGLKCSNFIGDTLDMALDMEFQKILFIGHIGKLVKIASGIMNTHSHMADARLETLCACALLAGADADTGRAILACTTTDNALAILQEASLIAPVMEILVKKIQQQMCRRTEDKIAIEVIVFSNVYGILGMSEHAECFIRELTKQHEERNTQ